MNPRIIYEPLQRISSSISRYRCIWTGKWGHKLSDVLATTRWRVKTIVCLVTDCVFTIMHRDAACLHLFLGYVRIRKRYIKNKSVARLEV